jgi:glycosyltransferase involved in cell wall biosynthesis
LPTTVDQNGFSFVKIEESAQVLRSVSQNTTQRKEMGERAFDMWKKHFSWEVIAKKYENLYFKLLAEKK